MHICLLYNDMRKVKYYLFSNAMIRSIFLSLVMFFFIIQEGEDDVLYLLFLFMNSMVAIFNMFGAGDPPYTLKKMVNLFVFVFLILANAIQKAHGSVTLTFNIRFTDSDYILFQWCILVILWIFNAFYDISYVKQFHRMSSSRKHEVSIKKLLIISSIATFLIISHYQFDILLLLTRGLSEDLLSPEYAAMREDESQMSHLLFSNFIRPIPWSCFIAAFIAGKRRTGMLTFAKRGGGNSVVFNDVNYCISDRLGKKCCRNVLDSCGDFIMPTLDERQPLCMAHVVRYICNISIS